MRSTGFKKLFPKLVAGMLLIGLFTAVIISKQRQDLRQRAQVSQTQPLGTLNSEGTPTPSPSLTQTAAISPPPGGPIGYIGCSNSRGTVS
ncbi:MAG TPA: hypothetical protein VNA13_04680, partial [Xanthomonadales bacterium]|nr:hypothetical protein [Xanthomonadales bacterium]